NILPAHLEASRQNLSNLDLLVVQELFETEITEFADVVLPAASFAESDGTYTNNGGLVQRIRQSIPSVNQSRQDWGIISQLASVIGKDFGYQMAATAVFNDIAANVPAYNGLRYPLLKDEQNPRQVAHEKRAGAGEQAVAALRRRIESTHPEPRKFQET